MASQHEVDVGGGQHFSAPMGGVVAQQDTEHSLGTCRCFGQVGILWEGWIAVVLYPNHSNAVVASMQDIMLVFHEFPPHVNLLFLQMFLVQLFISGLCPTEIVAIVVVAQDGINAIGGMQLTQYIYKLIYLFRALVHQVASKANHIALLFIYKLYHLLDNAWTLMETARVDVGYLHDAIAVEGCRQA